MNGGTLRTLKVFLCHASGDKQQVRALYKRLIAEGVDAWLDQERLLPGQDWRVEIPRAVQGADVVVVCLSKNSITKEGYIQKEIKFALDKAEEKLDDTIFLIPARLEECPVPEKLSRWQWVDLFEDNGYVKLLRSLKLRADKAGAVIVSSGYVDEDEEREQRLEQYYTEGLAAFYTEDWDKACQRFQLILSEHPNHKKALEKLEEAGRQRDLAKLYRQSMEAYQAEDWQGAIKALEELLKKSPEYRDSARLLQNARKQKQLIDLYSEAKRLHAAGKWQAVLKVFDQVFGVEPDYPDVDGLFASAKREMEELERLAGLNNLYSCALREMDMQKWREARVFLEQIHKEQVGFLETERLLKKVEGEIAKEEEVRSRNDQISTLYEQAHGLLRSENWHKALEKIDEIRKLDSQFEDKDGLSEKIRSALRREELEAQKQNQLAAMYADAVRLMKDGKYEDALAKWDEIKMIDPKYPDRQFVQRTTKKKMTEKSTKRGSILRRQFVITAILIVVFLIVSIAYAYGPVTSAIQLSKEYPIQIKIATSSDWTNLKLVSGGELKNMTVSYSGVGTLQANFDSEGFWLRQSLSRANGVVIVEMVVDAILTRVTPGEMLVFLGQRGCIGRTTVNLFNMIDKPTYVKTFDWGSSCSSDGLNLRRFSVPVDLFTR